MLKNLFHGVLLINKEKSWTSHDIVQKVRNLINQKQVGHAGTLDPAAEGLLVILLGYGTKLSPYLLNEDKRYHLTLKFGLTTDSYDLDGQIIENKEVSLKPEDIKNHLEKNMTSLELPVPIFSATKVKGKALYSYARKNKAVEIPKKIMSFYDLEIHDIQKDQATLSLSCSKGSYIRAFVHYIGEQLKTGACLTQLTRTESGDFSLQNSLTISELENIVKNNLEDLHNSKSFYSMAECLPYKTSIELNYRDSKELFHGKTPTYLISQCQQDQMEVNKNQQAKIIKVIQNHSLIALLELTPFKKLKVIKRFPLIDKTFKPLPQTSQNFSHESTKSI